MYILFLLEEGESDLVFERSKTSFLFYFILFYGIVLISLKMINIFLLSEGKVSNTPGYATLASCDWFDYEGQSDLIWIRLYNKLPENLRFAPTPSLFS